MPLPWVRLDSNIGTHDKILTLLEARTGYRAAFAYVCSIGYCGGHGTDGLIPFSALPFIHANRAIGALLVDHGLWAPDPQGWRLRNWAVRQELDAITEGKRAANRLGGLKSTCQRHHGPDCGCWRQRVGESE